MDDLVAQSFNEYYANVGANLASSISPVSNNDINAFAGITPNKSSILLCAACDSDIHELILSLNNNKSPRYDGISVGSLKACSLEVTPIICEIYNLCIGSGTYPDLIKIGKVIPVYK